MVSRKYTKDYKVEYTVNAKGKLRAVAIYCGSYYKFLARENELKKSKRNFLVFSIITLVCIISSLCFNSNAAHTYYVSLPHVVSLFPVAFNSMACFNLFVLKPPYTREQNDKTVNRQKISSLFIMIFTTIAFSMQLVNWVVYTDSMLIPNDIIYTCFLGIASVSSCFIFALRNKFNTAIDDSIK